MADSGVREFESHRAFQVWLYTVSHGQLLLLSVKTAQEPTRLEVLFKGVARMSLPTHLNRLHVEQAEDGVFRLSGRGWQGEVRALACFVAEDDGEYYDTSQFQHSLGPS